MINQNSFLLTFLDVAVFSFTVGFFCTEIDDNVANCCCSFVREVCSSNLSARQMRLFNMLIGCAQ